MDKKNVKKILEATVYDDTRTVNLMDRYEGYGSDCIYKQLVLRNIVCLKIEGEYEYLSLVVERCKDYRYVGDITFTELKQGFTKKLYSFLKEQVSEELIATYKDKDEELRFDTPFLFRAQNSLNRSGYGWGYGGTQYGETTAYIFVGAYVGYKKYGFSKKINADLENEDLSEFSIKNKSNSPSSYDLINREKDVVLHLDDDVEDEELYFSDELELPRDKEEVLEEDSFVEFIAEKRNIPDDDGKPSWFYAGFSLEINMFILALEQKIYLPPIIDECEICMKTDENTQDDPEFALTDMERTFMFVEMLANSIGYSGLSVLGLDMVHKRKILHNLLRNNIESYQYGEYGENSISFHLVADFLENQPELNYRGFVEIILSKYQDSENKERYELIGGFRDFGENNVNLTERHYWIGNDRYVLDEDGTGGYLQGIFEMAMNY